MSPVSFSQADNLESVCVEDYALQDHRFSLDLVALSKLKELFTKTGNSRFCSRCKDAVVFLNTLKIT